MAEKTVHEFSLLIIYMRALSITLLTNQNESLHLGSNMARPRDKLLVTKPLLKYYPFCQEVQKSRIEVSRLFCNIFSLFRSMASYDSTLILNSVYSISFIFIQQKFPNKHILN